MGRPNHHILGAGRNGFSLLARRLARTEAADLLAELPSARLPDLRFAIATLLRDPTADIFVHTEDPPGYRDLAGLSCAYDPERDPRAAVDLGEGVVLLHDPSLAREEAKLLAAGVAAIRLVLDNNRLAVQVRGQLAEVERSRSRILHATYDERRRVEQDLLTVRSSRCSASGLYCSSPGTTLRTGPRRPTSSTRLSNSCMPRSTSCVRSPVASSPQCSPSADSKRRSAS